jgi:hypothetical protein
MEAREFEISRSARVLSKEDGTVVFLARSTAIRFVEDGTLEGDYERGPVGLGRVDLKFDNETTLVSELEGAERKARQQADADLYEQLRMILRSAKP